MKSAEDKAYTEGFMEKLSQEGTSREDASRIMSYLSSLIPFGSPILGAVRAGEDNRFRGAAEGAGGLVIGAPTGAVTGAVGGGGAGALIGLLASALSKGKLKPGAGAATGAIGGGAIGTGLGAVVGAGEGIHRMTSDVDKQASAKDQIFTKGFMDKCAELGVDHDALIKHAACITELDKK